jgi:Rha family phage regulatory protein
MANYIKHLQEQEVRKNKMSDLIKVTEKNGIPVVSSRYISDTFSKQHKDVLEAIRSIECSEEFSQRNFAPSNFSVRGKRYPEFLITKDGFTFLAMGFKGKKAAKFKEDYINAFNQMESFIRNLLEAKMDFPEFTDAIMSTHEEPKHYHFSNELNMINAIVTGMNAKQFKESKGLDKEVHSIRPYLEPHQLEAVKALQRIDIGLIITIPDFQQRKRILESQYIRLKSRLLSA